MLFIHSYLNYLSKQLSVTSGHLSEIFLFMYLTTKSLVWGLYWHTITSYLISTLLIHGLNLHLFSSLFHSLPHQLSTLLAPFTAFCGIYVQLSKLSTYHIPRSIFSLSHSEHLAFPYDIFDLKICYSGIIILFFSIYRGKKLILFLIPLPFSCLHPISLLCFSCLTPPSPYSCAAWLSRLHWPMTDKGISKGHRSQPKSGTIWAIK